MIDTKDLKPEAIFCMDISEYAQQIELVLHDFLLPPPAGIYVKNRLAPVIVPGAEYFTDVIEYGKLRYVPIKDINEVKNGVYDVNFKLIIPSALMKHPDRWLSNKPFIPHNGMKILELLVRNQLDTFLQYRRTGSYYLDKIYRYTKPACSPEQQQKLEEAIDFVSTNVYDSLWNRISEFFDGLCWNMYYISIKDRTLTIERHCDWRIYDWIRRMESGEWK